MGPETKSAERYFAECLHLVSLCDELCFAHVHTVEHYFHPYGGYSPNPLIFLSALAERTRRAAGHRRGLPVFNIR